MADNPSNINEIKKNPKMMAAYLAYAKRRLTLNEVMFYFDKGNAQGVYPKYIDPKASTAANVSSKVLLPAEALAKTGDWDNKAWAKIIQAGKAEVGDALNGDIGTFCNSPEYKAFVVKEKMGDPTKAAKLLGIKDVKKLKEAMELLVLGETAKGKKLLEDLAKKEKLQAKGDEMVKALAKNGLA